MCRAVNVLQLKKRHTKECIIIIITIILIILIIVIIICKTFAKDLRGPECWHKLKGTLSDEASRALSIGKNKQTNKKQKTNSQQFFLSIYV